MASEGIVERYADLAVRAGCNLQPGQRLLIQTIVEHAPFARAIARAAYAAGASHVEVQYDDQHVRKAMIEHASDDVLTWTPPHLLQQARDLATDRAAFVWIVGDPEPELFADLDPARVGKARMLDLRDETTKQINERTVAWAIVAYPNEGWAEAVFGTRDVDRLWDAVAQATRLYEPDPVAAWRDRVDELAARAETLNALRLDGLRYTGPGTDLTVGLLPGSRWMSARFETCWGQRHIPNIPTEEVFTTPDRLRTEGTVRSTRPLVLESEGVVVEDLAMRFEKGKAVAVEASSGAEVIRTQMATDENGAFLGEVALVDRASAVGATGVTFKNTLFDENATSHIAFGAGFTFAVEGADGFGPDEQIAAGINYSKVHTDFMIGGPEVTIEGLTAAGEKVPIIVDDTWQL
ncbi:MAG TPA: aminopeptidase [Actinomycetota bacterium]|nr:aminopeptidase [Actinomycetota bacterium]